MRVSRRRSTRLIRARRSITGNCSDLNRIKGPILRGLAARAPYFHNGAAANLLEVVNFYNQRFQMNLTEDQKARADRFPERSLVRGL